MEETSAFPNPKKQKESSSFSALRHEPRPLLLGGRLIRRDESSADKEGHPAASPSASSSFRVGDVADDMGDSLPSEGVSYSFLELSASSSLGKVNESSGEAEEKSDKTFDLSRIAELQKLLKKRLAMKQLEAQKQQGQLDHFGEAAIEKERKRAEQEHRGERLLSSFLQQLQRSQKGGGDGRVYDWVTCPVGKDSQNIIDSLLILACTETQQVRSEGLAMTLPRSASLPLPPDSLSLAFASACSSLSASNNNKILAVQEISCTRACGCLRCRVLGSLPVLFSARGGGVSSFRVERRRVWRGALLHM